MTVSNWADAEASIRLYIETQWATATNASVPLVWENENDDLNVSYFMFLTIEGIVGEKSIYGGTNKRYSMESGIIFVHNFAEIGRGKANALAPLVEMLRLLELRTIDSVISMEGSNPPSPVYSLRSELDRELPTPQPEGNYYRVSGSVPFIVYGTR